MSITILPESSLTESVFYAKLRALLVQFEASKTLPYYDTTGNPTIGIGFNIYKNSPGMLDKVLTEMGVPVNATVMRTNISNIINDTDRRARAIAAANAHDWTALHLIDAEMQSALSNAYGSLFFMSDEQINTLFDAESMVRTNSVMQSSGVTYSNELIALVSLQYNNLYRQGTINALNLPDTYDARAETWYQIRYAHLAGQNEARRYAEAALFGLYVQGQNMSDEEARAVYRTYTKHSEQMIIHDTLYSGNMALGNRWLSKN